MNNSIRHVFVVMFENRSFDHMLGFSGIEGSDALTGAATSIEGIKNPEDYKIEFPAGSGSFYKPTPDAPYSMSVDPPHEFLDTMEQLSGGKNPYIPGNYPNISNSGFALTFAGCDQKNPGDSMKCFTAAQIPVIHQLAKEFVVCDHWFSSVPGPTWPNRFFLHAATSGGLDDSPSTAIVEKSDIIQEFNFQNGTIFDRLQEKGIDWRIYQGDEFAQSYSLHNMDAYDDQGKLHMFKKFSEDLKDPSYSPYYTFIEPCYGYVLTDKGSFKCGNSQHPLDDIRHGEKLLKTIYEAIRNSPHWDSCCLLVTYDEHGGFFDHVAPPKTVPPGDPIVDPSFDHHHFSFDQLGVRVPAIIISPLIPKNRIDHTVYDHTSFLKTINLWKELNHLTQRDQEANDFAHLFTLAEPRTDTPATLDSLPYFSDFECTELFKVIEKSINELIIKILKSDPISATARGFLQLAFLHNMRSQPETEQANEIEKYKALTNKRDALQYIEDTRKKLKIQQTLK